MLAILGPWLGFITIALCLFCFGYIAGAMTHWSVGILVFGGLMSGWFWLGSRE